MSRKYTPRRSGARWREEAPDYILDCFDHPNFADRYTVFFNLVEETHGKKWLHYLGIGYGASDSGDMEAYEVARYRYANKHIAAWWEQE